MQWLLISTVAVALLGHGINGFSLSSSNRRARMSTMVTMSAEADATGLQNKLFDSVNAEFGLKLTDFTEVYQAKSWKEGDWSGTCEWHDETKGSKLTGVSKNGVSGPNGYFSRTLNIWMGPGFLVPHLLLTVGSDPAKHTGISVTADFVPRGPFPLGSDQSYLDQHFSSKDVLEWYDSANKMSGAVPLAPSASFFTRLLRSPVCVAVGGLSPADADSLASAHVSRWMAWMKDAKPVEARQRGAINTRDDKQRQFYYRSAVAESVAKLGPKMGQTIGACSTGPVAEAYVGGGS